MIRRLLSMYHPRYVRSLVYLLQATEYAPREYLSWFGRVTDFRTVEKRGRLDMTKKALLLLFLGYLTTMGVYVAVIYLSLWGTPEALSAAALLLVATPYIILLALLVLLGVIRLGIQYPLTGLRVRAATRILANHQAYKIGIAGSYGKTTLREIVKTVLSEAKQTAAPPGSHNTLLGISTFIQSLNGTEEVLIFELGEYYPGDVRELCTLVSPDLGIIIGVNEAHLSRFKRIEKTVDTIFELSECLADAKHPVYVNGENEHARVRATAAHLLYSRSGVADIAVTSATTDLTGIKFNARIDSTEYAFTSQLLGLHHLGPLVAAIAIARELGVSIEHIQAGVAKTKPFAHRLEPKTDSAGVITLDDSYNGNPDGVTAVIDFLQALSGHRRFYVTPGLVEMGAATAAVHRTIGEQLAKAGIEQVLLIRNSVTPYIAEGLETAQFTGKLLWYDDAIQAFAAIPSLTVPGDVVLLQNDWPDQYV